MSSQQFNNGVEGFNGDTSFFPSALVPSSSLLLGSQPSPFSIGLVEGPKCEMGLQILSPSMGTNGEGDDGYFGVDSNKSLSLKLGDDNEVVELEAAKSSASSGKTGYSKLCARGHWRPAEDAKLRDLVAQYGPQNWNLIAEHLQGRSGT